MMTRCLKIWFCGGCLVLFAVVSTGLTANETESEKSAKKQSPYKSPVDLLLTADEKWLIVVNQSANSLSLIDTKTRKVVQELPVGWHPEEVAQSQTGLIGVTCKYSGDVHFIQLKDGKLSRAWRIQLGLHPHGIDFTKDKAYVSLEASGEVVAIDLQKKQVSKRIEVGNWPRSLTISKDGTTLGVGVSGDQRIAFVDLAIAKKTRSRQAGINIGQFALSADGKVAYAPWMVYRKNAITPNNIRIGWVLASRIGRVEIENQKISTLSLDPRGEAVADPHGIQPTPNEQYLVCSASGTKELLVYRLPDLRFQEFVDTDHIPRSLLNNRERFYRIAVGGRPMGIQIAQDNKTVYVANYALDSVQVIDIEKKRQAAEIKLGNAPVSIERLGESIFFDGKRSLDQWYSCHTCHHNGGTNSDRMDTLGDGSVGTYKTVLPLENVKRTQPWTWHGWQQDLHAAVRKSMRDTLLGPNPSKDDVAAVVAYLSKLELPPNPFRKPDGKLTEQAERGKKLFQSERAGCFNCHVGDFKTDGQVHELEGLGSKRDAYTGFNTPTLRGVYRKVRLLHDGRARTIEQVLRKYHGPDKLFGKEPFKDDELADIIAYLKSL